MRGLEWFCGTDQGGEKAVRQNQPRPHRLTGVGAFPWCYKVSSGAVLCFRKRVRAVKWRTKCHIRSNRK